MNCFDNEVIDQVQKWVFKKVSHKRIENVEINTSECNKFKFCISEKYQMKKYVINP